MYIFFNFISPVLFLFSLGVIIYAIILFFKPANNRTNANRIKAIKAVIAPLIYIIGIFTLSYHKQEETNQQIVDNLTGFYNYNANSSLSEFNDNFVSRFIINIDHTYSYFNNFNGDTSFKGKWKIIESPPKYLLLYDNKGNFLWKVQWRVKDKAAVLLLDQNGKTLSFIKRS